MSKGFTDRDVGNQSGKTAFITGANTGLGFETARVLAAKGARVLLGCRTRSKADEAKAKILRESPDADVAIVDIDLGDLSSVQAAAEVVKQEARLDLLINNAGLMMPPYQKTKDGFESQFGVNHIGTFALTGLLLDKLEETEGARVINTSSNGHKAAKIRWDNLNAEKNYSAFGQYALSKIANLWHMYELDRRLKKAGRKTIAVAVHPGGSDTDLARHLNKVAVTLLFPVMKPFLNSAAEGAWPTLMGATAPGVRGGEYFGPRSLGELSGPAKRVDSNRLSKDTAVQARMWDVSVEMSGVDPQL